MHPATLDHARARSESSGAPPPFARAAVLPIVAAVALVQGVVAAIGGHWFDEVYMLVIGSRHLDWGSADQPPVAPLLAALMHAIAPDSLLVLRLPAVLATAAAVLVAALIARELGGDRRAQVLTAGAQATALWTTMAGHWLTPYGLEPVEWLLLFWVLVRWLRTRDDRLLLALGVVAGVAAETKFQVLLLCAVLVVGVLVFGPRELLRRPLLWAGTGIAVVIAAPTLVWQAAHGWPQLQMGAVATAEAEFLYGGRPGVAGALVLMAGLAGVVLGGYGLWRLVRAGGAHRFLGVSAVVLYAFFVVTEGRPYYLGGIYGLLAAAGAVALQRRRESGHRRLRWAAWPAYALATLAAGAMLVLSTTLAPSDAGLSIAQRAADAYHGLPAADRSRTALMGDSYIIAAYLDGYGSRLDLPAAYSNNRAYGYFPPPPEGQDAVLFVGSTPDALRAYFTTVREVADGGQDASVWLCTGRLQPWDRMWSQLRTLTV
ncbi:glycosyltransferase family 39 protein [Pseudonocardia sp. GCM10023141]|uniref:glycosyltransferase family 39 protein n=1 Tax=Pseudonocardia sp. GCM10023141 TaxID=3252653 RepID=UPI00361614F0